MLIDKKKELHRASYTRIEGLKQPYALGKIKTRLSREFNQSSHGIRMLDVFED